MANDDLLIRVRMSGAAAAGAEAKALSGEIESVGRHAQRAETRSRGMGRGFVYARKGLGPLRAGVGGLAGALGFTGALGLAGAFKVSYTEAREAQKVNKATAAVLHSTGGAANVSAKGLSNLSQRLSNLSGVDDEVIQKSQNMLLTFRDIRNESGAGNKIFTRTSKAALDMSAAFEAAGKSLSPTDAALQLGKAVNDPIKGMTRLTRVGVTFTQQQIDQVTALQNSGHMLKAQKIIIRELNKEFGGQARSQADPVTRMSTAFHNLAENIGKLMLPTIDKFANKMTKLGTDLQAIWGQKGVSVGDKIRESLNQAFGAGTSVKIDKVVNTIKKIATAAWPVIKAFGRITRGVVEFFAAHPMLVKIAAAAFLIRRAYTGMVGPVLGAIGKIGLAVDKVIVGGATRAGKRIPGPIERGFKTAATRGVAAFRMAGQLALGAAALVMAAEFIQKFGDKINSMLPKVLQPFGGAGVDLASNAPLPGVGGPFGITAMRGVGGGIPRGGFDTRGATRGASGFTRGLGQSRHPHGESHGPGARKLAVAVPSGRVAADGSGGGDVIHNTLVMPNGKVLYEEWRKIHRDKQARG